MQQVDNLTKQQVEFLAKRAYTAYAASMWDENHSLPRWERLSESEKKAWRAVALAMLAEVACHA